MTPSDEAKREHRLAVISAWGLFGPFGICLILSGFAEPSMLAGLAGFATVVLGFLAHVLINFIFRRSFSQAQIALGLGAYVVGVLCYLASVVADPGFNETDVTTGLTGFTALAATFVVYIVINYGVRGSYQMVYRLHAGERRS